MDVRMFFFPVFERDYNDEPVVRTTKWLRN